MKPTIANLAQHIGYSRQALYEMKKVHPKKYMLLWDGWAKHCQDKTK